MSGDKNNSTAGGSLCKHSGSVLYMGPHKKATFSNPLVLHGQHFGQTVFALCNYPALLTSGILRLQELQDSPIEDYLADIRQEHRVFMELIDSYPGLLEHLTNGDKEDVIHVGELTLKYAVLEWLVPRGQAVILPLSHNIKSDHGFNHEVTGALLCPAGYVYDPEDPWRGLLRSNLLIFVQFSLSSSSVFSRTDTVTDSENFYHTILDLLDDPDEIQEVTDLMTWWTHWVFPNSSCLHTLSKIQEKRDALQERSTACTN
ncbi:hypothetical protein BDR06DRAFT_982939 [Suillus hirtellus]|nr:hypothetical protein BDR06DRAFT_982939 [Suillus hirtellus]